jgi:hypothetical protein
MSHNSLLELKIMKLFLLNTIKNQEPSKIGLIFLAFSVLSYGFLKLLGKRKRKTSNSAGPNMTQSAQTK